MKRKFSLFSFLKLNSQALDDVVLLRENRRISAVAQSSVLRSENLCQQARADSRKLVWRGDVSLPCWAKEEIYWQAKCHWTIFLWCKMLHF